MFIRKRAGVKLKSHKTFIGHGKRAGEAKTRGGYKSEAGVIIGMPDHHDARRPDQRTCGEDALADEPPTDALPLKFRKHGHGGEGQKA